VFPILFSIHSLSRFAILEPKLEWVFKFAKNAGFDGVELNESLRTRFMGADKIRQLAENFDCKILVVHQLVPRETWSTVKSVAGLLERARAIGASRAVVHIGSIRHSLIDEKYFSVFKELERQSGVTIVWENAMAQIKSFRSKNRKAAHDPEGFISLANKHNLSLTYDVGHMAPLMSDLVHYYQKIKPRLKHIHLHDTLGFRDHMPVGQGQLPLLDFLKSLKTDGYAGTLTLEVFPYNQNPFLARADAEEIIRSSLKTIRAITNE
jgi:sugar phosphate isomerase/epimerase